MKGELRIGLTGRMASGKGEAVKVLRRLGFRYLSLSDIVREEAGKLPGPLSREQMQDLGNRLRAEGGAGVLGRLIRERIEAEAVRRAVIDGIRNPAEVAELRRLDGFVLIGIAAGSETILARLRARARLTDRQSDEELRRGLAREWGEGESAGGQQVGPCMALADYTLTNESSLADLESGLLRILRDKGVLP